MLTHPQVQNARLRLNYLISRVVEDRLNASAAALTFCELVRTGASADCDALHRFGAACRR